MSIERFGALHVASFFAGALTVMVAKNSIGDDSFVKCMCIGGLLAAVLQYFRPENA